ncbi:MAG: hypothetical protein RR998_06295 [Oscillospiraceae bacterium]
MKKALSLICGLALALTFSLCATDIFAAASTVPNGGILSPPGASFQSGIPPQPGK